MSLLHHILRRRSELSCKDVNEFLVAYGEGDLDDGLRDRFENHLERCPCCKAYLNQYQTTVAFVHEAGAEPTIPPPDELIHLTLTFLRENLADDTDDSEGSQES